MLADMSKNQNNITLYHDDLPDGCDLGPSIAIDTETMGLEVKRDRLCLVQISSGDEKAHLVKISHPQKPAPNLAKILNDPQIEKLFHFARFDLATLEKNIGAVKGALFCTKIASKLARTYTDRHGLSELVGEILSKQLSKAQQSSDWGAETLTPQQLQYAAGDVLYLHQIRNTLVEILIRENRMELASACFAFLPHRVALDLGGFSNTDIFAH